MSNWYVRNCLIMLLCVTSWGAVAAQYPKVTYHSYSPGVGNTEIIYEWSAIPWLQNTGAFVCSNGETCFFGLIFIYASTQNGPLDTYIALENPSKYEVVHNSNMTSAPWEPAAEKWINANGMSGEGRIYLGQRIVNWSLCYGTVMSLNVKYPGNPQTGWSGACTEGGPPPTTCVFMGNGIINHGILKTNEVENNISGVTMSVRCSESANVKFSLSPEIDIGGGISSTLSIPSVPVDGKLEVSEHGTDIRIESRLNGHPKTSGKYYGTTVMTMEIL